MTFEAVVLLGALALVSLWSTYALGVSVGYAQGLAGLARTWGLL